MDWQDVGRALAKVGLPLLGAALPVPGGAALGAALASAIGAKDATPESVFMELGRSADARQKAVEFQATHAATCLKLTTEHEREVLRIRVDDRKSARQASVDGGTAKRLFWLSLVLLALCLGSEVAVLFLGYPKTVPEIIVGRILGLLDAVALMVLAFHYGSSEGSGRKTELLARAPAVADETPPRG